MKHNETRGEFLRFLFNGLFATGVHYTCFIVLIFIVKMESAAQANVVAATIGITISFLGSRYFVFVDSRGNRISIQALQFTFLYLTLGGVHVIVIWLLVDLLDFNPHLGFIFATIVQAVSSYTGNKFWVFPR